MRSDVQARIVEFPLDNAATRPPEARGLERDEVRLLVSTAKGHEHATFRQLGEFLPPGTLLVVNTTATLPASLPASAGFGSFLLNLSTRYTPRLWLAEPRWDAATPGPLPLKINEPFDAAGIEARLIAPYPGLSRLWYTAFDGSVELAMADKGEPIRYGYFAPPYPPLFAYQTIFAERPGSAEMPSAARPFSVRVLTDLRQRDILIAPIELEAGVSSLEVEDSRAVTTYPEPFFVPAATASAVNDARGGGRLVVAVGTTVVRALESAWDGQRVRAAKGFTRALIGGARRNGVVEGLITGFHHARATHLSVLNAIAGAELVKSAYDEARRGDYLWHEFGDSHLILRTALAANGRRSEPRNDKRRSGE